VLDRVRTLSPALRPSILDDLGLAAALRWYVRREAERAGFAADLEVEPLEPAGLRTAAGSTPPIGHRESEESRGAHA
jgi:signal transduction histidine kinase